MFFFVVVVVFLCVSNLGHSIMRANIISDHLRGITQNQDKGLSQDMLLILAELILKLVP